MPGTGEGKPPPLVGILREYGTAPLVLLTAAAIVPGRFGNGITIIGNNLERSFHIHDAALGAVVFVARSPSCCGRCPSPSGPTGGAARWWRGWRC